MKAEYSAGIVSHQDICQCGQSVVVDGKLEPKTFVALKTCNPQMLAGTIYKQHKKYYERIIARNPKQAVFRKGWLRRAGEMASITGGSNE